MAPPSTAIHAYHVGQQGTAPPSEVPPGHARPEHFARSRPRTLSIKRNHFDELERIDIVRQTIFGSAFGCPPPPDDRRGAAGQCDQQLPFRPTTGDVRPRVEVRPQAASRPRACAALADVCPQEGTFMSHQKRETGTPARGRPRRPRDIAALTLLLLAVVAPGAAPPNGGPPAPPSALDWPAGESILPSEPAGYIDATSTVSPTGEYRISIPLDVPPGRAGMAPTISLEYGSNAGNGIAGVGWTLSATSLIQRCQSTRATEGVTDGVDFIDDSFCLDGAKLILLPSEPGDINLQYRTERDPFSKIVASGDAAGGPTSFEVYRPDGRISSYTPVQVTRHPWEAPKRFAYIMTETWDRSGNSIRYDYDVDPGNSNNQGLSVTLWRILYTNKDFEDGSREVIFHYEPRPDPLFAYTAGVRTRQDTRLKAIKMRAPNPDTTKTVWHYTLTYLEPDDSISGRSLLKSVRKHDAQGQSLWAKEFEWAQHQRPSFALTYLPPELPPEDALEFPFHDPGLVVADVDGDGRDEVAYKVNWNFQYLRKATSATGGILNERIEIHPEVAWGRPLDRQKDGRMEIAAWAENVNGALYDVFRWSEDSQQFVMEEHLDAALKPIIADINGDGWNDLLSAPVHNSSQDENWYLRLGYQSGFSGPIDLGVLHRHDFLQARVTDLDGDGRDDVIINDPAYIEGYPPPDFVPEHTLALMVDKHGDLHTETYRWQLGDQRFITLADLNGDGLKDAVNTSPASLVGTTVRYNTGTQFGPATQLPTSLAKAPDDYFGVLVADFDRDGADDLLVLRTTYLPPAAVYLSRPNGFHEVPINFTPQAAPNSNSWDTVKLGDFNGDSLPDIVQFRRIEEPQSAGNDPRWNARVDVYLQTPELSDVIISHRDEGAERPRETVTYTRHATPSLWDNFCKFPQKCVHRGMLLVDEVHKYSQEHQLPRQRLRYQFSGGKYDLLGRGFVGFHIVQIDDLDTHARSTTYYDNHTRVGTVYPFAGVPKETFTIIPILEEAQGDAYPYLVVPGGTAIARVRHVIQSLDVRWLHEGKSHFTYSAGTVEKEWEQEFDPEADYGELLGAPLSPTREVVYSFVVDNFKNVTYSSRITTGGTYSWTHRNIENQEQDWLIGLETRRTQAGGEPTSLPTPRVTEMTYDEAGHLRSVVREPMEPTLKQTTWFYRDDRGLITRVMQTASGLPHRNTYLTFDDEGVFVRAVQNDLGHTTRVLRHPAFGVPILSADANGVRERTYYDGFGRVRRVESEGTGIVPKPHGPLFAYGSIHSVDSNLRPRRPRYRSPWTDDAGTDVAA